MGGAVSNIYFLFIKFQWFHNSSQLTEHGWGVIGRSMVDPPNNHIGRFVPSVDDGCLERNSFQSSQSIYKRLEGVAGTAGEDSRTLLTPNFSKGMWIVCMPVPMILASRYSWAAKDGCCFCSGGWIALYNNSEPHTHHMHTLITECNTDHCDEMLWHSDPRKSALGTLGSHPSR